MYIEYVPITRISIKKDRIRYDFGNLDELKESIKKYGLISPILLTQDYYLISGHRRFLVMKDLDWDSIPCIVLPYAVTAMNLLEIEMEENLQRKNFLDGEIEVYKAKKTKMIMPWYKKLWIKFKGLFKRRKK